ncbi:fas-binding factor 1 homolog [Cydia pomonella]|uniref:fas-binding factor 1 homolog n=1 Tax=Cydia pomonella TaxID=82600 RepID=UPI002ADE0B17|nr:fas-binding factor 1 homolog [Cydia pomonella]XP_061714948.1 fas-binding factor 1 homolog [Cydia pomonella]
MSFSLDDPLAGILSDGSDDSFFDDDILGKKKPAKKKTTPLAEKKSALFDLGTSDKPKSTTEDRKEFLSSDFKPDKPKPQSPATFTRTASKESIKLHPSDSKSKSDFDKPAFGKSPAKTRPRTSGESQDILGDLIPETKKEPGKSLERGKSSQSLLDDILGGSSTKTGGSSQAARPATAAKSQEFDFESFLGKSESKQTVSSTKTTNQQPVVKEIKKEPQKKSKASEDWLGIFQKEEDEAEDDTDMPSWLAGGDSKKKKSAKSEDKPESKSKQTVEEKPENAPVIKKEAEQYPQFDSKLEQLSKVATSNSVLQGSNEDITAEGAALYMQQQEAQLMVALQLKAQEEKLAAMQMRQQETQRIQREAALAHHAQFDAMLARQAEHRRQMQAVIAAHQDRITQRIQAMLGNADTNAEGTDVLEHDPQGPTERQESPHTKEKKQLLQLVQSLQENHDKEIDLMETSYRRQIAFLEISLSQSEERMKDESDKLIKFYSEKINWLEEHHALYKKLIEENLNSLTDRHRAETEILRQQHVDNVRVLQEHHASLMENIKNAVKQEQLLIQESAGFSSNLQELVADVKESKTQCIALVEKVQALAESSKHDNEKSLQIRETQINEMIQQLKKEKENFDAEKSESRDMVKMLETRLKQMTTMIEDETTSLKQKKMEFEFEKATFSKQTEFAKNVLKRQDEEMKMLKEDIQKEYKDKIAKIEEDKQKALKDVALVAKEKASTQSLKQEIEKLKTDLQAQLEEVTEERSRLNIEKQQMHMEEQRILAKSRDLDLLAKTAIEKQSQADKKYSEAEFIQRKYEERIRRIQEHVVSLNNREKQIAKEKVALSRERLNLHNERKQMEGKQQCSLCKSVQSVPQYNFDSSYLPETFLQMPVSRDFGNTQMTSAMTAIEQEMAHLMGQSFSLRHTPGLNINREERHNANDVRNADENVQSSEIEPGAFKDYMDPKFMMLRLDVQQVISNLDQNKTDQVGPTENDQQEE